MKGNGLIPKDILELLNYRINQEELSSRLYYSMYEWLEDKGYFGAAKMIKEWSDEEMEHAEWVRAFLRSNAYVPAVQEIDEFPTQYNSLRDIISRSFDHEVDITAQCNDLTKKVCESGFYMAVPLALKFMDEQVDELDKVQGWLDRLNLVGDDPSALLLIDQEMGG